ncbi:MAG: polysaccharide export protein, partial [Fervidobacterium sp.]|nr:polysaccharide export protein [Fervidobacterium sp.]
MRRYTVITLVIFCLSLAFSSIRVGDYISVDVFGQKELSKTFLVSSDGTISYPYVGTIRVVGLTVDQVKSIIEQGLRKIIKDPIVTVYIEKYAPRYVFLQGVVNQAIDISYIPNLTLTKVLSLTGLDIMKTTTTAKDGNTRDIDFTKVQLIRGGKPTTYNLLPFLYGEYLANDPIISEGDIIYLPSLTDDKKIIVIGAYNLTTGYEPGMSLRTLLLRLGPLDKEKVQIENAVLTIDNKPVLVNLENVINGRINYELKPGATLYIPKRDDRYVYVVGYVLNPGVQFFNADEEMTLAFAIAKAGGIEKEYEKWIEKINIITPNVGSKEYAKDVLKNANEVKLTNACIIEVKKYPEFKVYLTGDFVMQSQVVFEPDEPKTLQQLFVKIGGLKTDQFKWIESIKINGNAVDKTKLESYTLKDKDVVEIKKYPEFKVYLTGDFVMQSQTTGVSGFTGQSQVVFEPDEPKTLQQLFVKIGGLKT